MTTVYWKCHHGHSMLPYCHGADHISQENNGKTQSGLDIIQMNSVYPLLFVLCNRRLLRQRQNRIIRFRMDCRTPSPRKTTITINSVPPALSLFRRFNIGDTALRVRRLLLTMTLIEILRQPRLICRPAMAKIKSTPRKRLELIDICELCW